MGLAEKLYGEEPITEETLEEDFKHVVEDIDDVEEKVTEIDKEGKLDDELKVKTHKLVEVVVTIRSVTDSLQNRSLGEGRRDSLQRTVSGNTTPSERAQRA